MRVGIFVGAVVAAGLYGFGAPWWVSATVVVLVTVYSIRRERAFLIVGPEQMVPVMAGGRGEPIWWDTVESMYVDRRQPPSWATGAIADPDADQPAYVVVVRLRSGVEIPLWVVAASGGRGGPADPEGRTDAVLQQLEAAHRPSSVRVPSDSAGRRVRVRPADYWSSVRYTIFLSVVAVAILNLLLGLPWWVSALVIAVLVAKACEEQRS